VEHIQPHGHHLRSLRGRFLPPLATLFSNPNFLAPGVKFSESHSEESRKLEKNINQNENIEIVAAEPIETMDGRRGTV
jgi:hypothetical protein